MKSCCLTCQEAIELLESAFAAMSEEEKVSLRQELLRDANERRFRKTKRTSGSTAQGSPEIKPSKTGFVN